VPVVHENLQPSVAPPAAIDDDTARIPILFVIGTLEIGGAETQLVEMVLHLHRRFAPAVCCLASSGPLAQRLEDAGIRVTTIGLRGARHGTWRRFLPALLRLPIDLVRFAVCVNAHKPLIVHGVLLHAYVLGALIGRLTGVPIIVASRRSLSLFKKDRRLLTTSERIANRWTDLIIANSDAVRRDAIESEQLAPDKIRVIYNGLDLTRYAQPPDDALRRDLRLGPGPVVIVVANFIGYKGHEYFLRAWAEVLRTIPDATALLVGDGAVRADREADARALGIDASLRFLGTRRDVPALLAIADLLVHPSLQEGFCNALIEAMAAARPVVATDVGGNREAVVDGHTGLLVPPRDPGALAAATLDILRRADRGAAMGQAGRRRACEHFQRSRMVPQYEAIYDALIAQHAGDAHVRYQRAR
jgi:glycosyltransferase involved in cell wall biosynthesis